MRVIGNILPYFCIVAYVIFMFLSVRECDYGIRDFYDIPYHVTRDVRAIQARIQNLREILQDSFTDPSVNFLKLEKILDEHNREQDESFASIRKRFRDDPDGLLPRMDKEIRDLRQARRRVARALEGNTDHVQAISYYNAEIAPPLERLTHILTRIGEQADEESTRIQEEFAQRHITTNGAAVLLGVFLVVILFLNHTRETQQRHAIEYREQLFNLLARNIDDIFMISDNSGKLEYVSDNTRKILGMTAKDIVHNPELLLSLLGDDGAWLKEQLTDTESCEPAERTVTDAELPAKLKIRVYPVCDSHHKVNRHITVLTDETELLARQQTLSDALESARSANAAKSSFLAHMSHEIRTPMNAIIGMTTIAQSKIDDRFRVQDCLRKILESSKHLLGLINDVLDMSKIEGGKLAINHEEFDLAAAIKNIVNLIQPQTQARQQNFEVVVHNVEEESLVGDALRLDQVLINLLGNAIKFTPADGLIQLIIEKVSSTPTNVRLRFTVKDSGIGMSEEFLQRLYRPFEQATEKTAAKYGGTGLGLAITRNLITLMGGTITVHSKEGEGTEFRVELPFGIGEGKESLKDRTLPSLKVLVVDDDPGTCEHAQLLLLNMGMRVQWVTNGEEAIPLLKDSLKNGDPFDICMVDWRMPSMPGPETTTAIHNLCGDRTKIIIISSFDWGPIEKEAREAGATGFIAKPFFASNILDTFLSLLHRPETAAEPQDTDQYDFTGKNILLVEDNEFNREIGEEFLEMVNANVENAADGQEAVDIFKASEPGHFDLILMDVQMPVMNGHDATRAIRKLDHPDAKNVPILAMTANAFNEDVAAAVESGMNGHISKPIDVRELYRKMDAHMKGGQAAPTA